MKNDLVIQQPHGDSAEVTELLLLFHGVGSNAADLRPLGQALAADQSRAWVINVSAPDPSDFGHGLQWFSVQAVSEVNRPTRVASAMPAFRHAVSAWQERTGVPVERTTLIGFSQGAIMALESTQYQPNIAQRVVAIAGRFAQPPHATAVGTVVHFMHGEQDQVMPVRLAEEAHTQLQALGADPTLDRFAGLGHGIDARVVDAIVKRLSERQEPR